MSRHSGTIKMGLHPLGPMPLSSHHPARSISPYQDDMGLGYAPLDPYALQSGAPWACKYLGYTPLDPYAPKLPYGYAGDKRECIAVGAKGDVVTFLHAKLTQLGVSGAAEAATEGTTFGPKTTAAVKAYQTSAGFTGSDIDGIVGPNTWAKMGETGSACPSKKRSAPSSSGSGGKKQNGAGTGGSLGGFEWWHYALGAASIALVGGVVYTAAKKRKGKKSQMVPMSPVSMAMGALRNPFGRAEGPDTYIIGNPKRRKKSRRKSTRRRR